MRVSSGFHASILGRLGRVLAHRGGSAALEAALLSPMLVTLAVGLADYGLSMQRRMQVQHAAQAGADFAMRNSFNAATIAAVVANAATSGGITAVPAPVQSCGCAAGMSLVPAACNSACPDGTTAGTYVTVWAQGTYTTLIPYPGIPGSFTFTATAVTRTR